VERQWTRAGGSVLRVALLIGAITASTGFWAATSSLTLAKGAPGPAEAAKPVPKLAGDTPAIARRRLLRARFKPDFKVHATAAFDNVCAHP
jgi:hypothetical protein